jgi:hypothetical protein
MIKHINVIIKKAEINIQKGHIIDYQLGGFKYG